MVNKKIIHKKGAATLTVLIVMLLLAMGIYFGMFKYMNYNSENYNTQIPDKYNDTYNRLVTAEGTIDDNVGDIRDNLADIKEADSTFRAAWNGLKGLGNTLRLPVSFVSSAEQTFQAFVISLDTIPAWVVTLVSIGIIAFVVLLVLAILKGEPKL